MVMVKKEEEKEEEVVVMVVVVVCGGVGFNLRQPRGRLRGVTVRALAVGAGFFLLSFLLFTRHTSSSPTPSISSTSLRRECPLHRRYLRSTASITGALVSGAQYQASAEHMATSRRIT